jgi:tetratricopeptide (TPR) repeat protein
MPAYSYYLKSSKYVENQQYQKALAALDTAIALKPEVSNFYFAKGQIYEIMGNKAEAIGEYENALRYKSHYPDCWLKLASLYMDFNKPDRATQMLKFLTEYRPDSLNYELMLADAYLADHKSTLALDRVNYLENQDYQSEELNRIRGIAYYLQSDYKVAIEYLDKYVRYNPQNYKAQKYLGIAGLKAGMMEKGISHLNKALAINPEDPEIYLYRAKYFSSMQKTETAEEQYKLALKIDDQNSSVLLETAKFMWANGDTTEALDLLNRAVSHDKECWECYKYLGIIHAGLGNRLKAVQFLENYLSNIYFKDEKVELLLNSLKKSENIVPEN